MTAGTFKRLPKDALDLLAFWKAARDGRALPHRRSLDPVKMRNWLGDLSILEVHDGPKRIFVKLHGSLTAENVGQDFTRRYLEDCTPEHALEVAIEPYLTSIEHIAPTFSVLVPGVLSGVFKRFERLALPFTTQDSNSPETQVNGFMVWVGPTEIDTYSCASIYGDDEPSAYDQARARTAMRLIVIDVDDPSFDYVVANQPHVQMVTPRPLARLAAAAR